MTELVLVDQTALMQRTAFSEEALARFKKFINRKDTTMKGYETCLRQFFSWMYNTGVRHPEREDIIAYKEYLDGAYFGRTGTETLKAGTKQQYLRAVKQFFRWTATEKPPFYYPYICDNIHGAAVKHETFRKEALTLEETKILEDSIDRSSAQGKKLYAMILLATRRGLRTIELSRANVKDIHRKGGTVYIDIWGKGHDEPDATRALDPDVVAALEDYLQTRPDRKPGEPLFTSSSNRSKGQRIAPTTISSMGKAALVNAGFDSERLTFHSFRHTAGTMAVKNGDLFDAQIFLRHTDPKTTQIYTHVDALEKDTALTMKIYNAYHDSTGEAAQRQELISIVTTLDPAQLQQAAAYLRSLQPARV